MMMLMRTGTTPIPGGERTAAVKIILSNLRASR
uniref:Uncharacterized protein n=1 Tax=Tetranychus urticae TaxID=32264 RepID=T1K6F8_TETUR